MENPKLKPEQYWEWRFLIVEMQLAEEKLKFSQLQFETMMKDLEIARLKAAIFKQSLQSLEDRKNMAKKDYQDYKEKLEKELDISLNNKSIDDVTFEIKSLEE